VKNVSLQNINLSVSISGLFRKSTRSSPSVVEMLKSFSSRANGPAVARGLVVVATMVGSEFGAAADKWVTREILAWQYAEPTMATPSAPCSCWGRCLGTLLASMVESPGENLAPHRVDGGDAS